jgi:hypothetical protein
MVQFLSIAAGILTLVVGHGQAFTAVDTRQQRQQARASPRLSLRNNNNNNNIHEDKDSRRGVLARIVATSAAAAMGVAQGGGGLLATLPFLGVPPAHAAVGGLQKVNAKLQGYGLPPVANVPDGFTPLCDIYGKGSNRFPLLITFNHP